MTSQLVFGLRMQPDIERSTQGSLHTRPETSKSCSELSESSAPNRVEQSLYSLPDPADHPPRSGYAVGFIPTNASILLGPSTCRRADENSVKALVL